MESRFAPVSIQDPQDRPERPFPGGRSALPARAVAVEAGELAKVLRSEPERVLAAFVFGDPASVGEMEGPAVAVPIPALAGSTAEVWWSDLPVLSGTVGDITFRRNGRVLFGWLKAAEGLDGLEETSRRAYDAILGFLAGSGHPHLLRVWNALPHINDDDGGTERYRLFCAGRHAAFAAHGCRFDGDLPAASAVGAAPGGGLFLAFLASAEPGTHLENRRQVRAYRYPSRYGRRSPSFSRATLKDWDGSVQLLLSGTASIVGHETLHAGDVTAQLDETLRNVGVVLEAAAARSGLTGPGGSILPAEALWRVYLRRPEDLPAVQAGLARALGAPPKALYLAADICRRDLLVEIEGVLRLPGFRPR
jgi:chorismate lyase / 3-hydroxybenzoate synthase